jgi:hypothetical protein
VWQLNGSFTLAKFAIKTVSDSDTQQSRDSGLCTCLGHLGWHNININDPICVAPPKVAKASNEGDMASRYRRHYRAKLSPV